MIRILTWIGAAFFLAALVTFCWSIFRTQGVDEFIAAITVAAVGLGVPGVVALVLAGILGTLQGDESPAAAVVARPPTAPSATTRLTEASVAFLDRAFSTPIWGTEPQKTPWPRVIVDYLFAALAVFVALLARRTLDPMLGDDVRYATFFLAVAVTGWVGGFGPALFATVLSLFTSWYFFVSVRESFEVIDSRAAAGLGMSVAVELALAGITSGLRAQVAYSKRMARAAREDQATVVATRAALEECEARFELVADAAPVLIWMSDRTKGCTFFNRGWLEFTGRTLEQELGNGWVEGVHPDDLARCLEIYTKSFDAREPFAMQYRLRRKDGGYREILDRGVPRFKRDGTFDGYIGACMAVGERRTT